jgi:hypothetical protein
MAFWFGAKPSIGFFTAERAVNPFLEKQERYCSGSSSNLANAGFMKSQGCAL